LAELLRLEGLSIAFGGLLALDAVDLAVGPGETRALIGPNGSGKTTLINVVAGVYRPTSGRLTFDGHDLLVYPPQARARLGLARTFQNLELFQRMTALENVLVGQHTAFRASPLDVVVRSGRMRREEQEARARAAALLDRVGLSRYASYPANALAFGHQRLLEIARALAARPKLLLLDEPGAGLTVEELDVLGALLRQIQREEGIAVLLVAHTMRLVLGVADRVSVLDHGVLVAEGEPQAVVNDPRVIEAYLGRPDGDAAPA